MTRSASAWRRASARGRGAARQLDRAHPARHPIGRRDAGSARRSARSRWARATWRASIAPSRAAPSTPRRSSRAGRRRRVHVVEPAAGVGQLAQGLADLTQQRPHGPREAVVSNRKRTTAVPSIGPRTARWYICSPDRDEHAHPLQLVVVVDGRARRRRRPRQDCGGPHPQHPGRHVGPFEGPPEPPHGVGLVVVHRRGQDPVEPPALGDHPAEEALADPPVDAAVDL